MSDRRHPMERKAPVYVEEPAHTKRGGAKKPWAVEIKNHPQSHWGRLFRGDKWRVTKRYRTRSDAEKGLRNFTKWPHRELWVARLVDPDGVVVTRLPTPVLATPDRERKQT